MNPNYFFIQNEQHYSYNIEGMILKQLELYLPKYNLNVGLSSHAKQAGKILIIIENDTIKEKPETIEERSIILADTDPYKILRCSKQIPKTRNN